MNVPELNGDQMGAMLSSQLPSLFWALIAVGLTWYALNIAAVVVRRRSRRARSTQRPAVTVLKPLCGADPGLRASLETFFTQTGVDYELLFGVEDENDPAIVVVQELISSYPHVSARLVRTGAARAANPKVRNLLGLVPVARHDLVLISDSNVIAHQGYLADLADRWVEGQVPQPGDGGARVGLVTGALAGVGETSAGGVLDAVRLNGFVMTGTYLPNLLGQPLVIGKTMMFSRSQFGAIGGLARLGDVLAEDYVAGRMIHEAGLRVAMMRAPVQTVIGGPSLLGFARRHIRWAMMRVRLNPAGYVLEMMTSPLVVMALGLKAVGPVGALAALGLLWLRDVGGWVALRGIQGSWRALVAAPIAEIFAWVIGFVALAKRHVAWRGTRLKVGRGTVLSAT